MRFTCPCTDVVRGGEWWGTALLWLLSLIPFIVGHMCRKWFLGPEIPVLKSSP
jgi:hypothetical protein